MNLIKYFICWFWVSSIVPSRPFGYVCWWRWGFWNKSYFIKIILQSRKVLSSGDVGPDAIALSVSFTTSDNIRAMISALHILTKRPPLHLWNVLYVWHWLPQYAPRYWETIWLFLNILPKIYRRMAAQKVLNHRRISGKIQGRFLSIFY